MPKGFDEMSEAEAEPIWATFKGDTVVLEFEDEEVGVSDAIVGILQSIEENAGKHNSRLYTIRTEGNDRPVKFWGTGHINQQVNDVSLSEGDHIGISPKDETVDTGKGNEMQVFDVRYHKPDE